MENTELASDISFLERFQQIKEKLIELIATYESKIVKSDLNSQIDNIKNLTVIGFETSKILNVIENFVITNKIQQNDDVLEMLNKYKKHFPFLSLFTPDKIHVVNIIDLMLSLPMSYDLNLNIYNMMTKFLEKSTSEHSDDIDVKNVSYLRLIKNLVDALYHYKIILNREITLTDLLTKEIYPLTSNELSSKLERYKLFNEFNKGERGIDQIDAIINHFPAETNYFQRILKMTENMRKLVEFSKEMLDDKNMSIEELLKLDIESILTNLVFIKNISPESISNIASSLNTNLVHVIVKNAEKFKMTNEIMEYVTKRNYLIGFLLEQFYNLKSEISYEKNLFANLSKIEGNFKNRQLKCDTPDFNPENMTEITDLSDLYIKLNQSQIMEMNDELVVRKMDENNVELISDINLRARKIISLIPTIESPEKAKSLIKNVLLSKANYELEKSSRKMLENWLHKISIYRKIMDQLCLKSWLGVKSSSENNPQIILHDLLEGGCNIFALILYFIHVG